MLLSALNSVNRTNFYGSTHSKSGKKGRGKNTDRIREKSLKEIADRLSIPFKIKK